MLAKSIWVLEDDLHMQEMYQDMLAPKYELKFFPTLQEFKIGLEYFPRPQLLILDLVCPDGTLHTAFESFADLLKTTPFLVVSGLDEHLAVQNSFNWGALDFISKPFSKSEIQVKVDIFLNRQDKESMAPYLAQLDPLSMTLYTNKERSIELTAKEYRILSLFLQANDQRVLRRHLVLTLWKDINVSEKTLDVHLSNIRRKISSVNLTIVSTEAGYELQPSVRQRSAQA